LHGPDVQFPIGGGCCFAVEPSSAAISAYEMLHLRDYHTAEAVWKWLGLPNDFDNPLRYRIKLMNDEEAALAAGSLRGAAHNLMPRDQIPKAGG